MKEKIISGIYGVINKKNGKIYVGQTENIFIRYKQHLKDLRNNKHFNYLLQNDFNKYGEKAFELIILERCNKDMFNEKETYWRNHFIEIAYNLGHTKTKGTISDLTKQRMSQKSAHYWAGKKRPKETGKKISIALKGRHLYQKTEFKAKKVIVDNSIIYVSINECAMSLCVCSGDVCRAIVKKYNCKGHKIRYYEE